MITEDKTIEIKQILEIIPHRYPFLLIDRIHKLDLEAGTITAQKNVTFNEQFFQGHFPGSPIMPGVLILEAMAQAGGVLVYLRGNLETPKVAVLMNITNAKFRMQVKPGDVLLIKCQGIHFSSRGGKIKTTALVDDKIASEAEMSFCLVDKDSI